MSEDRGQALVFTVLILGLAAAVMVGLRDAQERILDQVRDERAGEAAVAAAGKVVADQAFAGTERGQRHPTQAEIAAIAASGPILDAARSAAAEVAALNGRGAPSDVTLHAYGYELEVHLTLAGRQHIALIAPPK